MIAKLEIEGHLVLHRKTKTKHTMGTTINNESTTTTETETPP